MPVARWGTSCQMLHIVAHVFFFSLAILPLQLGSVVSRSTANVASYSVANGRRHRQFRGQKGRITRFETSSYAATSFSTCKMDETSDKQYCTTLLLPCIYCLCRFLRKEGSGEGLDEPIRAERTVLTFNIVRNCLGSFEFMEGRWAGYGQELRG